MTTDFLALPSTDGYNGGTPEEPEWMRPPAGVSNVAPAARVHSSGLTALSWTEIMAEPAEPPPMLATGIPKVGLTVLAGPPKVGKSLYASQTALELRCVVLYVAEEGSLGGIGWRLRRQAAALGIVGEPPFELAHRQHVRLDNRGSVAALRARIEATRPALVIIDPLNRAHGADENRPTQMTPVMDAMAGIAYDFGCAVVAIHHLAKPSAERRGDIWDRFRGASSIRSGTDANLIMDGSGETVRLYGEFRDAEPLSMYLTLDRETLTFQPDAGPKTIGKIDPDALAMLADEKVRVTARDVMARFGVVKMTALAALEAHPELDRTEGPRGQFVYFRTVQ
jgi:hypothetical protein